MIRLPGSDRGSVTAETAVVLPVIVLVLGVLLAVVAAGTAQLRVADAARTSARVAALGEDDAAVRLAAQKVAGSGAKVVVVHEPPWVRVTVQASIAQGWAESFPLRVTASASARVEP